MVYYVLNQYDFFLCGYRGRVSHAKGFVNGVIRNDEDCTVLSGPGTSGYLHTKACTPLNNISPVLKWKLFFYWQLLKALISKHRIFIRWRLSSFFLILLLIPFRSRIIFELNSETGKNHKHYFISKLSFFSVALLMRFFTVTVVSNFHRNNLVNKYKKAKVKYIPNGFIPIKNLPKKLIYSPSKKFNLIFYSKKQKYYDWNYLESLSKDAINEKLNINVIGFNYNNKRIYSHKPINDQEKLFQNIYSFDNPILLMHGKNNEIAISGFPMKLSEYFYLGLPIIASKSYKHIFDEFGFYGLFYDPSRYLSFIEVIQKCFESYDHHLCLSKNNSQISIIKLDWKQVVKPLLMTNEK